MDVNKPTDNPITDYHNEESSRDAFCQGRNTAKCTKCGAVGHFLLNGSVHKHHVIQFKKFQKRLSHSALRRITAEASSASCAPVRPKKPAPVPEVSATELSRIKMENARLIASNKRLQEQNDALHAKVDSLTSKMDVLITEIRDAESGTTDGRGSVDEQKLEKPSTQH